jgi:multicomponent K+:H+ antiporter subunit F
MVYGLQVVVNLALGVFRLVSSKPGESAAPYFLSALLVLIIGFGACSVMIMGGLSTMN